MTTPTPTQPCQCPFICGEHPKGEPDARVVHFVPGPESVFMACGARLMATNDGIDRGAELSEDGVYRYSLRRTWRQQPGYLLWIMLNPSTADALKDDATVRKCMGFARRWGYGSIAVANLYAYRATNPAELELAADPVGPYNDETIRRLAANATGICAGWGGSGPTRLKERVMRVVELLPPVEVACIGRTRKGHPRHPSRPGYATPPEVYFRVGDTERPAPPPPNTAIHDMCSRRDAFLAHLAAAPEIT